MPTDQPGPCAACASLGAAYHDWIAEIAAYPVLKHVPSEAVVLARARTDHTCGRSP